MMKYDICYGPTEQHLRQKGTSSTNANGERQASFRLPKQSFSRPTATGIASTSVVLIKTISENAESLAQPQVVVLGENQF